MHRHSIKQWLLDNSDIFLSLGFLVYSIFCFYVIFGLGLGDYIQSLLI